MNVILAVSQHASKQRDELIAERNQLLRRVARIGSDLAILDAYELLADEHDGVAEDAVGEEEAAPFPSRHKGGPDGPV